MAEIVLYSKTVVLITPLTRTSSNSANPYYPGYGYQWWIYRENKGYGARGFNSQHILLFPYLNMVIVSTGNSDDIPFETFVEEYILPATLPYNYTPWIIGGVSFLGVIGLGVILFIIFRKGKVKRNS